MRRHAIRPRPDWRERARALGFAFAEIAGEPYWDEGAAWELSTAEVDALEAATAELQRLCLLAAEDAVRCGRHAMLGIPESVWPLVVRSWERREPSLYGRMDLRWDGTGPPKLLEYNADTPTALYEAAVIQWEWLQCAGPALCSGTGGVADQFNGLHEALIAAWRAMDLPETVHFACARDSAEDRGTVDYLRDTAMQAGKAAPFLYMDEIGWNEAARNGGGRVGGGRDGRCFLDLADAPIRALFKLYPWEWLLRDAFGHHIGRAGTRWIEPAWRLILAGKGILALLWELFPGHPNLLPAFRAPGRTGGAEIAKPLFGREGANVAAPGWTTSGPYGAEGFVHQAWAELPCFGGRYPVLGTWLVAGQPCGLGIREDATPITRDTSRFVPHYFPAPPDTSTAPSSAPPASADGPRTA